MGSGSQGGNVGLGEVGRVLPPGETLGTASATLKPLRCRAPETLSVPADNSLQKPLLINADSEVLIRVFNTPDDRDPKGVLARPGAGQIDLSPAACWLAVRHGVGAAPPLVPPPGETVTECWEYRRHEHSEGAAQAVVEHLLHPRFAHRLSDVRSLRPGEALAFEGFGLVALWLDVGLADVLSGGLGSLAGVLGGAAPLGVRLPAGARVRGVARVSAPFFAVFVRLTNGRTRVTVKKGATPYPSGADRSEVAVELADAPDADAAVHDILDDAFGLSRGTSRTLAEKAGSGEPAAEDATTLEALSARLGPGRRDDAAPLLQKLRELGDAVGAGLAELARDKLARGAAYEIARLPTGAPLLQASLDPDALERLHPAVCRGDLVPLVRAVAECAPGAALETYLQRRTVERARCWGFTLGVGAWASKGRQRRTLTRVDEEDRSGRRRTACLSLGAYEGRWLADLADWTAELRADMPRFPAGEAPRVGEFDLGLHLSWRSRHVRLEAEALDGAVDMALLWRVADEADAEAVRRRLASALGRPAEVTVQLRVDNAPLRALLPAAAAASNTDVAAALGAAMAWRRGSPGRAGPARRAELYGPLWEHVLDHPDAPARDLVARARERLVGSGDPQLGFLEENYLRLTTTSTFVGLARVADQGTAAAWTELRSAALLLHEAITSGATDEVTIETAFAPLAGCWRHAHHLRALGAFLAEAAVRAGVLSAAARVLTVTSGDGEGGEAAVVAAPSV